MKLSHYRELRKGSGIDRDIIALNWRSLSGSEIFETIYPNPDRRNDGRLTDSSLKRWERCLKAAGWVVNGINPLTGDRSSYCRVKQTSGEPIVFDTKKRKAAKYLSPKNTPTEPIFLNVPDRLWEAIAQKYTKPRDGYSHFWEWVIGKKIPIVIEEGEKKAGAALSRLVVAITIPGIYSGYRTLGEQRRLVSLLEPFDDDRQVTINFDYREGDYFKSPEWTAAKNLGFSFKNASVKIARKPGPEKGTDDFVVAGGNLDELIASAKSPKAIKDEHLWRCYRSLYPNAKIHQKYFDYPAPKPNENLLIKSGLGTGKSYWVRESIASEKRGKIFDLGYRNGLLLQHSEEWNSYHLHEHNGFALLADPDARLSLCLDSLLHIPDDKFDGATIILDEVCAIIKHSLKSGTLRNKRKQIIDKLRVALVRASRIIGLDGTLSNDVKTYLEALSGKQFTVIENTYKGDTPPVFFCDKPKDFISLIQQSSAPICIATDSKAEAEALYKLLTGKGQKGLLVCSKTVGKKEVKAFLKNPDDWTAENKPDFIIFTPTAESGLNISIRDYFSDVFVSGNGVIGVDELYQMSRRCRYVERIIICCKRRGMGKVSASWHSELIEAMSDRLGAEAALMSDEEIRGAIASAAEDPSIIMACKLEARASLERQHLRDFLELAFKDAGFNVGVVPPLDAEGDLSEIKESVKRQECREIPAAEDIPYERALELGRAFVADWEDQCKVIKAKLLYRLPGVREAQYQDKDGNLAPLWSEELIYLIRFGDRQLLSNLEARWLYQHPEAAEKLQRHRWRNRGDIFWPDWGDRYIKAQILKRLGFDKFLDPDFKWHKDSPEVQEFLAATSRKSVSRILGKPGKYPTQFIGRLLREFGFSVASKQERLADGERVRVYCVAPNREPMAEALMEIIAQKFEQKITALEVAETQAKSELEADTDWQENISNIAQSVPQNQKAESANEGLAHWMAEECLSEIAEWLAEPDRLTFEALITNLGIPVLAIKEAMKRLADDIRDRCLIWLGWSESWQKWRVT